MTDSREQEEAAQTGGEGQDLRPPSPAVAPHLAQRVRPRDGGDRHTRRDLPLPPPRAPRRVQRVAHTGETADLRRLDQKLRRARHEQRRGTQSGGQVDGSARDRRPSPARHGRHDQAVKRAPHQHERRHIDRPLHRHGAGGRRAARLANPGESRPCGLAPVRRQDRERKRPPQQVPIEVGERLPGRDVVAGHEAGPQADPHLAVVLRAEVGRPPSTRSPCPSSTSMNESSAFRGSVKTAVTRVGASSSRASATGSDRVGSACADASEGSKRPAATSRNRTAASAAPTPALCTRGIAASYRPARRTANSTTAPTTTPPPTAPTKAIIHAGQPPSSSGVGGTGVGVGAGVNTISDAASGPSPT